VSGTKEPKGAGTFSLHTCVTPYWRKSYPPLPCLPAVWRAPAGAATHPPYRFPSAFIGGFKNHQPRREEAVQGKGESCSCLPWPRPLRTCRLRSSGRSQGGPACPERSWKGRAPAEGLRPGLDSTVSTGPGLAPCVSSRGSRRDTDSPPLPLNRLFVFGSRWSLLAAGPPLVPGSSTSLPGT